MTLILTLTGCGKKRSQVSLPSMPAAESKACGGKVREIILAGKLESEKYDKDKGDKDDKDDRDERNDRDKRNDRDDDKNKNKNKSQKGSERHWDGQISRERHNQTITFALDLLRKPNLQIQEAVLVLQFAKKPKKHHHKHHEHHGHKISFKHKISINGLEAHSRDGRHLFYRNSDDPYTLVRVNMNAITVGGGTPFLDFLNKIIKNNGVLKIVLAGHKEKILAAKLHVFANDNDPCPPPPPKNPVTVIDSADPEGTIVRQTSMAFAFHADQVGVSFTCQLDNSTPEACTSVQTYSNLENGSHIFKVWATNSAGLSDLNPPTHEWTVDAAKPVVTIAPQPTLTNKTNITLIFTTSKISTAQCSLDGGDLVPCVSPVSFSGLTHGPHVVAITAVDALGNMSMAPATFAWTVDLVPPVTSIISSTPAQSPTNTVQKQIVFTADETADFRCALDDGSFEDCTSPISYNGLIEGPHTFQVQAIDLAGNAGNITSLSWVTDLTPPVVTLTSVVPAAGPTNAINVSVAFTADEPSSFICSLDGETPASCNSPFTAAISQSGPHDLVVAAFDLAGNQSSPVQVAWVMDYITPAINFQTISPTADRYVNSSNMTFEVFATEPLLFTADLDGSALTVSESPIVLSALAEGAHVLTVTGVDLVGNPANTLVHEFITDTTPPLFTVQGKYSGVTTNQTNNEFAFVANEDVSFQCQVDSAGFTPCTAPYVVSGLGSGHHIFEVKATDLAGNASNLEQIVWDVDTIPPVTQLVTTQKATDTMMFTFTSSEPGSTFVCVLDLTAAQPCVSPLTLNALTPGEHTFVVNATDSSGNTDSIGATVRFVIQPPVNTTITQVVPSGTPTNQRDFTFTFTSNHVDATFQCALDDENAAPCSSPLHFTDLTDGHHNLQVQAIDRFGLIDEVGAAYAFFIDTTAPTVVLVPQETRNPTNSTTQSFTFSSNDEVSFQCALNNAAYSNCASPITLTGLSAGSHHFKVIATDLVGNVSSPASYSWTIDLTPPTTTVTVQQTSAQNFTLTLTSSKPASTFQCSLDGAPASTCAANVTYMSLAVGAHTFKAWAVDSIGNVDPTGATANFTAYPPITTTLDSQNPQGSIIYQSSVTFTFHANHTSASFLCTLDGVSSACTSPRSYTGLANGPHQFKVQAIDAWGTNDVTGTSATFTVDTTPPQTSISATANSLTSYTFSLSSSKPNSTFLCAMDGAPLASCTPTVTYSNLSFGNHQFFAKAIDAGGNADPTGATHTFNIVQPCSTTKPVISQLTIVSTGPGTARATWKTDVASTSQILYTQLPNGVQNSTTQDLNLVTDHTVNISGLRSGARYSGQAVSSNCAGSTTSAAISWNSP